LLADAIEQLGELRVETPANPIGLRLVRRALLPLAMRMKAERQVARHAAKPAESSERFEKNRELVH
jgi:hypothetical protein